MNLNADIKWDSEITLRETMAVAFCADTATRLIATIAEFSLGDPRESFMLLDALIAPLQKEKARIIKECDQACDDARRDIDERMMEGHS